MNYLDSNLLTLNNHLLRANFDRILDSIWVEVLEEIQDVLNKEDPVSQYFKFRYGRTKFAYQYVLTEK